MFLCICPEMMHRSKTSGSPPPEPLWRCWKETPGSQFSQCIFLVHIRRWRGRAGAFWVRGPPATLLHYYFCSFPAHFTPRQSGECSRAAVDHQTSTCYCTDTFRSACESICSCSQPWRCVFRIRPGACVCNQSIWFKKKNKNSD